MSQVTPVLDLEKIFNYTPNKVSFVRQQEVLQRRNAFVFDSTIEKGRRKFRVNTLRTCLWPEDYKHYVLVFQDTAALNDFIYQEERARLIIYDYYDYPPVPPFKIVLVQSYAYSKFILDQYEKRHRTDLSGEYENVYELLNGQVLAVNLHEEVEESLLFTNMEQYRTYKDKLGSFYEYQPSYPVDYVNLLDKYITTLKEALAIQEDISEYSRENLDLVSWYVFNYAEKGDVYKIAHQLSAYYCEVLLSIYPESQCMMRPYQTNEGVRYVPVVILKDKKEIHIESEVLSTMKYMRKNEFVPGSYWLAV
ncbi:hypothetical protein QNI19_17860 [Cytophagaceae bacterium DM2B3-1]|uniref:Uncharacterized protein n=1 Tax=Xanthocytophaga flava TaxID=3048013 RepID=A0ABT7CP82_9BACT|nr:hypothetical protein [Xanthocytophaga flavus]MDJ1494810.1 hypothetical protein [Xanthocytophaga flavus]